MLQFALRLISRSISRDACCTGSLMARSYLEWGVALTEAKLGAVAVLSRGSNAALGHVGFVIGASKGKVFLLGGNQSDSVTISAFDARKVLGFRWPAEATKSAEVPAAIPPPTAVFDDNAGNDVAADADVFARALANVLELEGGFSNDPHDPGGPTNRGITLAVYARFKGVTVDGSSRARLIDELKRISDDTVQTIYRQRYWEPGQCAAMPPALALFHFDAAVNHGVAGAARLLQRAVHVTIDGEIGPQTLGAIGRARVEDVLTSYAAIRRERYRALPHFWRFGRGWLRRVDTSLECALALSHQTEDKAMEQTKGGSAMEEITTETESGKWWAKSKTIWGAVMTAAATLIPLMGPLLGIELSADAVKQAGDQTLAVIQAAAALIGTLLTIYGRLKAGGPLTRRSLNVRF